jgi:tetratricopeptide (TPR) repeat protein
MRTVTTILTIGLLSLSLGACKKKGESETPTSPGAAIQNPGAQISKEAKKDFDDGVQLYAKAKSDGTMSASECDSVANKFARIYKDHGDQVIMARFNEGAAWDECGQVDKARPIYEDLANKKFQLAMTNLGVIYWNEGKTSRALEMFEKAVDADKKKAFTARNNLAAAYRDRYADKADMKDFTEAEKQIQNILAVDTSNKAAYENLARLYYDRGRLKDRSYLVLANLVVTQALRVLEKEGKQSADIYNLRGLLFMQDDNQIDALRAFKKAVEVDGNHVDANLNIAFISLRFRDYPTAETSLATAMKHPRAKRNVEAAIAMAVAKRGLKKYKEAQEWNDKASKVSSRDPRPWYNLGILNQEHLIGQDNVDQKQIEEFYNVAKKHYAKFIAMAENDKAFKDTVQDAKDRIIIIDDAIETFRKMEELEKQAEELRKKEEEAAKKEHDRLLELERKAREAAAAASSTPAPAPAPATDAKKDAAEKKDEKAK